MTWKLPICFSVPQGYHIYFCRRFSLLHAIGETVVHTFEATYTREAANKIDLGYDLEAPIRASFSTTLPSILVGNKKETIKGEF